VCVAVAVAVFWTGMSVSQNRVWVNLNLSAPRPPTLTQHTAAERPATPTHRLLAGPAKTGPRRTATATEENGRVRRTGTGTDVEPCALFVPGTWVLNPTAGPNPGGILSTDTNIIQETTPVPVQLTIIYIKVATLDAQTSRRPTPSLYLYLYHHWSQEWKTNTTRAHRL